MAGVDEDGGIVLVGEELEGGGIFKGVDVVLLVEFDAERTLEGVEVFEGELGDFAGVGVAQEEGGAWILDYLRAFVLEISLRFGRLGLDLPQRIHRVQTHVCGLLLGGRKGGT